MRSDVAEFFRQGDLFPPGEGPRFSSPCLFILIGNRTVPRYSTGQRA